DRRAAHVRHQAAGHPDHHPGVAVPHAHLRRPGGAAWGGAGDRGRGARSGREQARCAPGAVPGAAGRAARGPGATDRLSATVRPPEAVATYLTGGRTPAEGGRATQIVQPEAAGARPQLHIDVVVPVPDLSDIAGSAPVQGATPPENGTASIWSHVTDRVTAEITSHSSTIVFANSRRGAERLAARITEAHARQLGLGGDLDPGSAWAAEVPAQSGTALGVDDQPGAEVIARPHHGSMSRDERTATETALKNGTLPAVVATSSLELGIDMGAVDLVVQVGSPPSVASALQRI